MDAYDIFRKLTRGAKFTAEGEKSSKKVRLCRVCENILSVCVFQRNDECSNVKLLKKQSDSIETVTVKEEKPDEDDYYYSGAGSAINLLGSMQASENGKKAKKRKAVHNLQYDEKKQRLLEQEKVI